ncbi:glycoside hydrolase [Russula ochroleuca]|uniref:mannan endo-1,4-beta-mannosidase n=1 Tax=Russula ochroleuca TaxID=152965 RepID=A0A9P5T888_9AGAM|nr:glycoside hydrolase [Russula ochroleuca]
MYSLGALAFSLFSLLSVISAFPSPTSPRNSKRWSSRFVTVSDSGSEFSVGGQDFKFVGTNAYWLPYLNSEDDICNTLANMSKAGITVVRTWAFNDVDTIPDAGSYLLLIKDGKTTINTGPNGIQRLDTIIALAKKYNIRVHFTLTNNWFPFVDDSSPSFPRNFLSSDYGGMDLYVKEFGVTKTHDEFYTNMTIRGEFNKYVQFLVSRYANEPGIFAWELANDARCESSLPSSDQCNTNTVTKWHAETAKFIRSIDPNHLITSGTHGFFCPTCPKLFPSPPPPKPSPAPGSTHKRTDSGLMSRVLRLITLERRIMSRASGANGMTVRGLWTAPSEAKRHTSDIGPAFNGAFGVDSEDILNAPDIDFGTFQLFPDQNHYGITGNQVQPPSSNFNTTLNQTTAWISAQADTIQSIGKPVVLTAFGIVTQDNLLQFVPFNSTCPLVKSQQDRKRQNSGANAGVDQQQFNSAYNAWLQRPY